MDYLVHHKLHLMNVFYPVYGKEVRQEVHDYQYTKVKEGLILHIKYLLPARLHLKSMTS